jgi:hypothetical protein
MFTLDFSICCYLHNTLRASVGFNFPLRADSYTHFKVQKLNQNCFTAIEFTACTVRRTSIARSAV